MSRLFNASRFLLHAIESTPKPTPCPRLVQRSIGRAFSSQPTQQKKAAQNPPRPKPPPESEIDENFLKGSGPGGQKINKTSSAVQLKHLPTGLVVKCQATRSRTENRKIARQLLADKLDDMSKGEESRSAIVGKAKGKKRASAAKKKRRKYRKLDEAGGDGAPGVAGEGDEELEDEEEVDDESGDEVEKDDGEKESANDQTDQSIPGQLDREKT